MTKLVGPLALIIAASGCDRSPEFLEGDRVLATLNRLRQAPSGEIAARRHLVQELAQLGAALPQAKAARDDCSTAYRLLLDGTELTAELRVAVEKGTVPKEELAKKLALAEEKIAKSSEAMPACDRSASALRSKLR